jgi:EAL domain-containing protein (putative c-di-GMP-specific phosphodiesterase class I)
MSATGAALALAACDEGLRLHAQPIIDTQTGAVAGYEALSRFPEAWQVNPQEVYAAADEHGVSSRLTMAALRRALALRDRLPPRTFLTVNCSPADLTDPEVQALLAGSDLRRIFVELTESAWPEDEAAVLAAAALIRRNGGRIAADDVGAGYAGLLQLVRLRPELVKVDKEIVQRVEHDPAAAALVAMLGELVGRLDGWLVAEGVETTSQLDRLVQLGVPLVQGYLLGRPAEPWAPALHGEHLQELSRRASFHEHLVAHRREPHPGELVLDPDGLVAGVAMQVPTGLPAVVKPLTMAPSTSVSDALLRVMARPTPLERVVPVVLTDQTGRPQGVVPVERLVEAVVAGER